MIAAFYLAKVMAAQCLLLLVYHLLFDRFPARNFARVYLVLGPLLAFLAPLLDTYPPQEPASPPLQNDPADTETVISAAAAELPYDAVPVLDIPWLTICLLGVHLIGVAYGLIRMGTFLLSVRRRLKSARLIDGAGYTDAVLPVRIVPHTFLRWVFYASAAPPDPLVLAHERSHARQRHSVDRLFIAFLRIVWWWNPALYGFESAIRANHEFLADRAVLQHGAPLAAYQLALLSAMRSAHPSLTYASQAGTSLTIKRFQLMEIQLPKSASRLLRYAMAVVLALSVTALFGSRSKLPANAQFAFAPLPPQDCILPPPPLPDAGQVPSQGGRIKPPTQEDLLAWRNVQAYGVWLDGKRIPNETLEGLRPEIFDHYYRSRILSNAVNYGEHDYQIDLFTKEYFRKWHEVRPDGTFVPRE